MRNTGREPPFLMLTVFLAGVMWVSLTIGFAVLLKVWIYWWWYKGLPTIEKYPT